MTPINLCAFRVIDTETTGLTEDDRVVEVAFMDLAPADVDMSKYNHDWLKAWLVNPGIPIPPEASAIHHLTGEHVKDALTIGEVGPRLVEQAFGGMPLVYVAHNAEFDRGMLRDQIPKDALWLCTRRLAAHLLPHLDRHNNQYLRYSLKLCVDLPPDTAAHRAAADVVVTAALLEYLLPRAREHWPEVTTIDELISRVNQPIRVRKIGFGKHAGTLYAEVDPSYLEWMLRSGAGSEDDRYTAKCVLAEGRRSHRGAPHG